MCAAAHDMRVEIPYDACSKVVNSTRLPGTLPLSCRQGSDTSVPLRGLCLPNLESSFPIAIQSRMRWFISHPVDIAKRNDETFVSITTVTVFTLA